MKRHISLLKAGAALGLLVAGCALPTPEEVAETLVVTKEVVATTTPTPLLEPGTITAYMLIFSGREDPKWEISNPDDVETLRGLIADLPVASPPDWPTLGWRGVLLQNGGAENFPPLVHVFDGIIEVHTSEGSVYLQDSKGMEEWLLERLPLPTPAPPAPMSPTATPLPPTPAPAPPEIISIDFPSQIPADGSLAGGTVRFRDPDGDVNRATFDVVSATDFASFELDPLDFLVEGNARDGVFDFHIWSKTVQEVTLRITLYDAAGNSSTPVDLSFKCE